MEVAQTALVDTALVDTQRPAAVSMTGRLT